MPTGRYLGLDSGLNFSKFTMFKGVHAAVPPLLDISMGEMMMAEQTPESTSDMVNIGALARQDPFGLTDELFWPYQEGKSYLVRTVTMFHTGRLVGLTNKELVLEDAAWIADTGFFAACLATGELSEVEPFPDGRVIVNRDAVIDAAEWNFPLPRARLPRKGR